MSVYHGLPNNKLSLKSSGIAYHLLICNHSTSYDDFRVLTDEYKNTRIEKEPVNNER